MLVVLTRDLGRSRLAECAGNDWRDGCLRMLDAVGAVNRDGASSLSVDGFRDNPRDGVAARLGDRDKFPILAAEDAVGAVIEAGRRTGRVGDFDRAVLGEEWNVVFFELSCDGVPERAGLAAEDMDDFVFATFDADFS